MMRLNEKIYKMVRNTLNEAMGINKEVVDASSMVLSIINDKVANKLKGTQLKGVNGKLHSDTIKYDLMGTEIKITYSIFSFDNEDEFVSYKRNNPFITKAEAVVSNDGTDFLIKLKYIVCDGVLMKIIYDQTQHELNHIFQQLISGKKYTRGALRNNVDNAVKNGGSDKDIRCACFILYMSRRFEQDGFANGLYSLLASNNNTKECIEGSGGVHNLRKLRKAIDYLTKCADDDKFIQILGISKGKIIKKGINASVRLKNLLNRVIFNYMQETGDTVEFID